MRTSKPRTKPTDLEIARWETTRAESGQFLQVPLELSMKFDLLTAGIWAVIFSYQQMNNGVCSLSLAGIGKLVGCNKIAVCRKIQVLVEAGYVELRKDNRLRGQPNWYVVTSKCQLIKRAGKKDKKFDKFTDLAS